VTAQELLERVNREEEEAWRELEAVFARVPAERFEEAGVTHEGWSPKDLMYHVAAWAEECARVLEEIGAGRPVPDQHDDTDTRNRTWFDESRGMEPDDVRAATTTARRRMLTAFGALPDVTNTARSWFEESGALHYREHAVGLSDWLDGS
jgi:Mycothiol maleylpyruvate isomerase N-terminal domain